MSNKEYILDIKTGQSTNIRILFEVLKDVLLSDINLHFTNEGIKAIEMDGKEQAMVHLNLTAEAFENYYCSKPITVGINASNFFKIIKISNVNDVISFYIEKSNPEYFIIRMENSNDAKIFESKIKILNINKQTIKEIPPINFSTEISLPSSKFQKYMKNIDSLGLDSKLEIRSIGNQVIFSCKGEFSDNKIVLGNKNQVKVDTLDMNIVQGIFPLKFIILFTKATNLCQVVNIYIKNDFPLILKYSVGNLGYLNFVLKSC